MPGAAVDFGDANLDLRIGDDFQDLSRTNFEVAFRGGMFFDHSEWPEAYGENARQLTLEGHGRIARAFGRSSLSATLGYEYLRGQRSASGYDQGLLHAALRYGFAGGVVRLEVGADFYRDRVEAAADPEPVVTTGNYLIPFAHFDFNLGTPGLKPFLEVDGGVSDNSLRSLMRKNPYAAPQWLDKSSVDYCGRFGLGGSLWRNRFGYRLYAGVTIHDNRLYWAAYRELSDDGAGGSTGEAFPAVFLPLTGRQTVTSFNGEVEYRPLSVLTFDLGVHGYLYNDEEDWNNGAPSFAGNVGVRYEGRKVGFGVEARMQSERRWMLLTSDPASGTDAGPVSVSSFEAPFGVDLRVDFDWKVSGRVAIFAEGRNLLDRELYEYPWFPELGARFTVGVKANF